MGATYTRQSTYADGDTISADDTNDEFDQLLAAFAASSGHTHDGTTAEGGPVTKLLGNTLTFGAATAGTDITITFDGETNDGVFKWMEDEDYFEFSDDILIATTEKIQFRDTAIYINSSADGQLDLVADTEIQIAATTIDINGAVVASGEIAAASLDISGDIDVDGTSNLDIVDIDGAVNIAADVTIASTNKILFNDASQFIHGSSATVLSIAATDEIDLTATAIDINGTVDLSSTLATGGLYTAGAGITSTAAANTLGATSFSDANITNVGSIALDTITSDATDITVDAAGDIILDAGGANVLIKDDGTTVLDINNASSDVNLTVSVADKNFAIKGTDGASAITALDIDMALAGKATFSGDVVVTGDLTISGDDLVMGTNTSGHILVADGTNFNPTAVGDLSEISTVANDDVFLAVDTSGGGLKKITRSAVVAGLATSSAISNVSEDSTPQLGGNLDLNGSDIVTTSNATLDLAPNGTGTVVVRGNTNSGAVVFNCESNSHGQKVYGQPHSAAVTNTLMLPAGADSTLVSLVSADTLTNKTFGDNTSFGDNNITNVGDIALDSISADGTDINVAVSDNSATALTIKQGSDAYLIIDTANSSESVSIGTGISGTAITLGHSTSEVTVSDNLTVAGDFTVNGTTTTVATTNMVVSDNLIELNNGATSNANDSGIVIERGSTGDNAIFMWDESADTFVLGTTTATGASTGNLSVTDGALQAGSLDISGNIDVDGTANLDVVDIDGAVDMATTLTLAGNADFNGDLDVDGTTNLDVVDIDGAVDMASTLQVDGAITNSSTIVSAGKITADAGIDIDNFNIDGTTIALSSGDMTLDAAGDIILDAAGNEVKFRTNGTAIGTFANSSSDFRIISEVSDKDIIFRGNDGGSFINALTLDMSDAGTATFNHDIKLGDNAKAMFGAGSDLVVWHNGSNSYIQNSTGNLNIQAKNGESSIVAVPDDKVTLYHNNLPKIATSATGVTVTGTAVATTDTDTSNTGNVTLDFAANQNFVLTLTGNTTLVNPSTEQVGQSGFITLIQDGTGGRTLSLGTDYETAGGAGITLTSTASATDIVPYVVAASGRILLGAPQLAFS